MVQYTNIFVASIFVAVALPALAAPHGLRSALESREVEYTKFKYIS